MSGPGHVVGSLSTFLVESIPQKKDNLETIDSINQTSGHWIFPARPGWDPVVSASTSPTGPRILLNVAVRDGPALERTLRNGALPLLNGAHSIPEDNKAANHGIKPNEAEPRIRDWNFSFAHCLVTSAQLSDQHWLLQLSSWSMAQLSWTVTANRHKNVSSVTNVLLLTANSVLLTQKISGALRNSARRNLADLVFSLDSLQSWRQLTQVDVTEVPADVTFPVKLGCPKTCSFKPLCFYYTVTLHSEVSLTLFLCLF